MEKSRFQKQLQAYDQWKANIQRTVEQYGPWLKEHGMSTPEIEGRINDTLAALRSDRLTIAFVAEFSRGKTELINAIFFADYGRRLLPSTAGRTTMCPTEMFWDKDRNEPYVRLLPIETRMQDATLSELKNDQKQWVHYPLELDSADQIETTLQEVVQTKRVTVEEAGHLGLGGDDLQPASDVPATHIDIPKWRHALISFPHTLLKEGLTILDTPGLNALGSEPELTLSMLPSAQAVLFVLGADTGVTRSDLEMWQHHIKGFQSSRQRGLMVVLNKIDTLWDDLQDEASVDAVIAKQKTSTAKILGISEQAIFPVSAQKGLLAKVRDDKELLKKSELLSLEEYLSNDVLKAKQQIVLDTVGADVGFMLENSRNIVSGRLSSIKKQLDELDSLSGKSDDVIEHLMEKTRKEQAEYIRNVNSFQTSRKELGAHAQELRAALDMNKLDQLIKTSRKNMTGSWTTMGLKMSMKDLFEEMRGNMQKVVTQSGHTRKLIRSIYRKFQNEHDFSVIQPKMFSIMKYRVELELLHQEAEMFRKSPVTTMTEQHFVIKKFFMAMVSRARDIFAQAHREISKWLKHALEPLVLQIRDHKDMMEKRLTNLQKIGRSRNSLQSRVRDLQNQYNDNARQLTAIRNMYNTVNNDQPLGESVSTRPRLVSNQA